MNDIKTIYTDKAAAINLVRKDICQIATWADDLSAINEELEKFIKNYSRNTVLYQQLLAVRRENTLRLATIHRYENSLSKAIECDAVARDAYYFHHYTKHLNIYMEHLQNYREIKTRIGV